MRLFKTLKRFLTPPKIRDHDPMVEYIMPSIDTNNEEYTHNRNIEQIALADLEQNREALQHTLNLMHRTMLISLVAVIVSILAVVVALN